LRSRSKRLSTCPSSQARQCCCNKRSAAVFT
jgi:hypothetical protein